MEYRVVFSKRKTISIGVKDGRVTVKAPYGTSDARIDSVVTSHLDWIMKHLKKQEERNKKYGPLTDERIAELRKLAKEVLPPKVERFAKIMGLKYGRITITSAKTRFGSCSSKGNISYSYLLMTYPEAAREYVVVHELAHLVEMNHSPAFYKVVAGVMPDYKERAKLLKN